MPSTTTFRFGDVLLVPFPFSDQSGMKKRPAVVVSSAEYGRRRSDVIIMAVTSQMKTRGAFGEAVIADWKKAGLLKPSVTKPVIATVERTLVLRRLGRLPTTDRESVIEALRSILSQSSAG